MDDKVGPGASNSRQWFASGDKRIRQVDSANYSDYMADAAIVTTTGIAATLERSGAYVSVEAIASEGDEDQTGWGLSVGRAPGDLSLETAASDAIRRATRMLGAVKAPSSKGMAVFDPRTRRDAVVHHGWCPEWRRRGTRTLLFRGAPRRNGRLVPR